MSQDPTVKMCNTLEFYRAKAENVETKFGGGTITMLATDFMDIFKYIRQLQNDVLVQMEDKEDAFTDCAAAEDELRRAKNRAANLEHEVLELDQKLKDAETHAAVLQQIIDWQRWLLDEVEAEDAAKEPTP